MLRPNDIVRLDVALELDLFSKEVPLDYKLPVDNEPSLGDSHSNLFFHICDKLNLNLCIRGTPKTNAINLYVYC